MAMAAVGGMMAAAGGCGAGAQRDAVPSVEVPKEAPAAPVASEAEREATPPPRRVERRPERRSPPPAIDLDEDDASGGVPGGVVGGVVGGTLGGAQACCRGWNECKGKGNCKTDKHDCKGKNECKGKGGCKPAVCP